MEPRQRGEEDDQSGTEDDEDQEERLRMRRDSSRLSSVELDRRPHSEHSHRHGQQTYHRRRLEDTLSAYRAGRTDRFDSAYRAGRTDRFENRQDKRDADMMRQL